MPTTTTTAFAADPALAPLESVFASENFKAEQKHETAQQLAAKYSHHIKGKTVLITGASPLGLGAKFVESIAISSPAMIILAGPSVARLSQTAVAVQAINPQVQTPVVQIDLGSMESVRTAAAEINRWVSVIDVLVLNAGIMGVSYGTTVDGFEKHFGTNHIGHFLLTNLLVHKLLAAPRGARIISVASEGHMTSPVRFDDLNFGNGEDYNHWLAYGQSKTANALFAVELASRLKQKDVLAFSVHPGLIATGDAQPGNNGTVATGIGRNLTSEDLKVLGVSIDEDGGYKIERPEAFKSIAEGAATHVFAAFDPQIAEHSGSYTADVRIANDRVVEHACSPDDAQRLWKLSEKLVGQKFDL